ncbi:MULTISPECIES: hypothetical protein [unclassified Kitasatospora]|uniref:hypothetical protein n=1 Tax=unclassified Kitasatospora TaxID=2633591 RepID=UPI00070B9ED0|nr:MULTISPECIES: hypothetical protein [unclassified Kitasatospora]KQV18552.1 hypothetical protein ASC99_04825 [Kitasatospora sp. Root107]KRB74534.1 hypothetical protein ASE03_18745 [Kitasatospora sp. Root187]
MSEQRAGQAQRVREWLLGAAPAEPRTLAAALGLAEDAPGLQHLRHAEPELLVRIERLHTAAQHAFERRTRVDVCRALERVVRVALREAATAPAREPDYLKDEADGAAQQLEADAALAGGRGLNTGLAFGILLSPVVLILTLAVGRAVPPLFHGTLGCPEQLSLMYSLVCFSGGAMGAVFSVIIRLRDAYQLIQRGPLRSGSPDLPANPVQLARTMRQEGWYRVVVGWFLATSLFLLINGGILTLLTPPATPDDLCGAVPLTPAGHQALIKAWFFWGSVGFLAGLNERWAYGLLRRGNEQQQA